MTLPLVWEEEKRYSPVSGAGKRIQFSLIDVVRLVGVPVGQS
jgi:hypothetical protein